ncbi:MAG: MFS transporter [Alphaproteobacteria bacterium]|nr:MFS transporter [Alphaproteobacteria bacterium]
MSAPAAPGRDSTPKVPLRLELAVYGAATFSNSLGYMIMVVLPLWVLTLDVSPLMVGVILGARHFLVLIYSIHGGAMMDRLDVRRVMISFGVVGAVLPLLFPLTPWVWALIVLQMLAGYCTATGWMGAQAIIGQAMHGSAVHTGRMSFAVRIGSLIGPPVAGAAWDLGGPWGAFGVLSVWGMGIVLCCLALPAGAQGAGTAPRPRPRLADLVPRPSDYVLAFRMLALPLVAVIMAVSVLRIAGFSIQASFYAVYLEGQGYNGTAIGVLLAVYSLLGGGASLTVGSLTRRMSPLWLMIAVITGSTAAIAVTPLLGNYALLLIASAVNGACYGMSQPLVITTTSRVVGRGEQGKAVGLRTTANRLAATFMPVVMGAVVQWAGLAASFYIAGGTVIVLLAVVALWMRSGKIVPRF